MKFREKIAPQIFFTIIIVIAASFSVLPQNILTDSRLEKKILKGLDETFKFNFEKSEKIFDEIIRKYPDSPVGYHFKSIPYLWRYLDNKNDSDLVKFNSLSDSVLVKTVTNRDDAVSNPFNFYILGSTYSLRAMASASDESYLDVVWSTKKSYSYMNEVLSIDSTFYDAYLGLGLYNFMVAQTPPALRWAMNIAGISGDADKGMEYLRLAVENGKYSKVEAKYYLSQILIEFYLGYEEANQILTELNKKYPKNLLFKYSLGLLRLKMKNLDKAEKTFKYVIDSKDSSFNQLIAYSNLSLGNLHYYKNEFDTAKYFYGNFLTNSSENYFLGIAALRLGLCYAFTGDSLTAVEYFKLTDEGNSDIDDDRYAAVKGDEFDDNYPDSLTLKTIFIGNLIDAGNYATAMDSLFILKNKLEPDTKITGEINLMLSDVEFYLDSLNDSFNYALSVINQEDAEDWLKPFACYYAARASFNLGNFDEAEKFIIEAEDFNDYFYENELNNSLNALSYKIKTSK